MRVSENMSSGSTGRVLFLAMILLLPGHGSGVPDRCGHVGKRAPRSLIVSSEDFPHYLAVHVGEAEVAALELVGEPLVLDAEQVEHGGVQVVHLDDVLHGVIAQVVGT